MKFRLRGKASGSVQTALEEADAITASFSLGTGALSSDGSSVESFVPSPPRKQKRQQRHFPRLPSSPEAEREEEEAEPVLVGKKTLAEEEEVSSKPVEFQRLLCSFLRVSDLKLHPTLLPRSASSGDTVLMGDSFSDDGCGSALSSSEHSTAANNNNKKLLVHPNFHHVSNDPPPGVTADPAEQWIALDNGAGLHAPVAPLAIRALVESAVARTNDKSMWKPESKTGRLLQQHSNHADSWYHNTFGGEGQKSIAWPTAGSTAEQDVLVWSGNFAHGGYGSDLPAVRAAGIIPMSAKALLELLVDSDRVHEYNKLSLGRTDVMVLQDSLLQESQGDANADAGPFGGITKVMRSETRPPLVRKTLQFTSLLHARRAPAGHASGGYHLVTRAVEGPAPPKDAAAGDALKSEILLGVNLLLPIGDEDRCLLIAVNHVRSPMVPMMIAKRIGLTAAVNFYHDVRKAAAAVAQS